MRRPNRGVPPAVAKTGSKYDPEFLRNYWRPPPPPKRDRGAAASSPNRRRRCRVATGA